jgi:UDP-N-acetylmuramoylalanine--D-glutamate ligase
MEDYVNAKSNIFRHQAPDDIAIYFSQNEYATQIASLSPGTKIPYFTPPGAYVDESGVIVIDGKKIINKKEVKLLGEHNLQNICAAITTVWQVHQDTDAIRSVLSSFSGLEHRLEFVREVEGVKYYDDSFGTTPETAIVAIKSFEEPKIVILGGSDKGASFDELAQAVGDSNVKHTIVIGAIADKIVEALSNKGYRNISTGQKTMLEIVEVAKDMAEPGDIVLLSTGAASFGMFKNYKDRGEQFKKAVQSLT